MPQTKRCSKCEEHKPLEAFSGKIKKQHTCKECCSIHKRKLSTREKAKSLHLSKTVGITLQEYDEAYDRQGGCCAIPTCGRSGPRIGVNSKKSLAADHCHRNGRFRGLLCQSCNFLLGHLESSGPKILEELMRYAADSDGLATMPRPVIPTRSEAAKLVWARPGYREHMSDRHRQRRGRTWGRWSEP